jgi:uncharacterized protein (TIGR02996 family)
LTCSGLLEEAGLIVTDDQDCHISEEQMQRNAGEGLLQAIIEEPEADDLRLLYADWLEDHGDPARAEFIRVQLAYAALPEGHRDGPGLKKRQGMLLHENIRRWCFLEEGTCGSFKRSAVPMCWAYGTIAAPRSTSFPWIVSFRRGFMDTITCSTEDWLAHGSTLARANPIRMVTLRGKWPVYQREEGNPPPCGWRRLSRYRSGPDVNYVDENIWDCLPPGNPTDLSFWRTYGDFRIALTALSNACLAQARANRQ